MHRSGTSCLAGVLESMGAFISPNVSKITKDNQKGNKEDPIVYKLNDRILNSNKFSWHKPPLSVDQITIDADLKKEISDYKASIRKAAGAGSPLIKDPRMIFCLNFWMDNDPGKLIGTFRHPHLVVRSLKSRNKNAKKPLKAEWLRSWIRYNRELLKIHDQYKFPLVNFNWDSDSYYNYVQEVAKEKLELKKSETADSFYEKKLIHQQTNGVKAIKSDYARDVYEELLKRAAL